MMGKNKKLFHCTLILKSQCLFICYELYHIHRISPQFLSQFSGKKLSEIQCATPQKIVQVFIVFVFIPSYSMVQSIKTKSGKGWKEA